MRCAFILKKSRVIMVYMAVIKMSAVTSLRLPAGEMPERSLTECTACTAQQQAFAKFLGVEANMNTHDSAMLEKYKIALTSIPWDQMPKDRKPFPDEQICIYKNDAVGFTIPKVASSSQKTLGFQMKNCESLVTQFPKYMTEPSIFRFAIVRDPMSRFISGFNQAVREAFGSKSFRVRQLFPGSVEKDVKKRFTQFLKDHVENGDIHTIGLFEPQSVLLLQKQQGQYRLPDLDFLTNLASLSKDFPTLANKLGISEELPHKNGSQKGDCELCTYISEQDGRDIISNQGLVQQFCNLYAADYALFSFPLPSGCDMSLAHEIQETWPDYNHKHSYPLREWARGDLLKK